ncbi:ABC transporter ATP-binding protein [Chroococcidiopsis sp. CCNUC1]|uniref:ABC transporter ATP-binding protein n=1 Tax=Chroococcidiopsis sp. CCNUC1 TaxID=2653189 RepID=UPI000D0578EA|nr:ABC transporter ATP-binding protein [Chroococcidiopsis sp. CCNUC1]PSB49533.1 ABC transporter ATP-binding protein [Cyanosarcina cf. burmensis CCALA 770]URD53876.1 ABC transporter ATP-binding protein/permease [Chroococcidiopsis sp. CCNUC1]
MMNQIFRLAGQQKPQLIQGTVLHIIASMLAAVPYGFVCWILVDLFERSLTPSKAALLCWGIGVSLLLQGLFLYWANVLTYKASFRMLGDLRLQLGNHIRRLPMGFFTDKQVGDLNTLVTDDMRKIELLPSWVYPKIFSAIATPTVIALFLAWIDWRLTLATLAGVPIAIAIYLINQTQLKQLADLQKRSTIEANSRTIEYIQGLAVLKAFNQTGFRFQNLKQALEQYRQANLKLVTQLVMPTIAFSAVLELGFVAILIAGTYFLFNDTITVPTLLLFLVLGWQLYVPLSGLFDFSARTRMMNAALLRVVGVLNTPPLPTPDRGRSPQSFDIEFKEVSFSYENTPILQNVSFRIPECGMTALVGPSGAGKTTITNLIARFWDVDSGEIWIGGVNIKDIPSDELLSHLSMVFQQVYLFNDTILNNIKFGNSTATEEAAIAAAKAAQCHEFIMKLPQGYDTTIGEGGATLSGGEKQRIAIARAILKDAPIVLLDEATASVDPENEQLIQTAINALVQSKTLIVIAHQLSTITSAEQILVIDRGQLVEQGKHAQLLALNGVYRRLWDSRQQARQWKVSGQRLSSVSQS